MKLAISNIAWSKEEDVAIYRVMQQYGCCGLEVAPTRIVENLPYQSLSMAETWAEKVKTQYHFEIPSMQSILFGCNERLFGTDSEREVLLEHLKKAICFADAIGCKHLVFGSPKNRILDEQSDLRVALSFFREIGSYAVEKGQKIGFEATPEIYGTNYINTTEQAALLVREINHPGVGINLDFGTIVQNNEPIKYIAQYLNEVHHVHISEPLLKPIVRRFEHKDLLQALYNSDYQGYISIEMKRDVEDPIGNVERAIDYLANLLMDLDDHG